MIIQDEQICGGSPIIEGTKITIAVVLANIRGGVSFNDICKEYIIAK